MANVLKVKPCIGKLVRNPEDSYNFLPEYGRNVINNTYWRRRLKQGDVQLIVEEETEPKKKKQKI